MPGSPQDPTPSLGADFWPAFTLAIAAVIAFLIIADIMVRHLGCLP